MKRGRANFKGKCLCVSDSRGKRWGAGGKGTECTRRRNFGIKKKNAQEMSQRRERRELKGGEGRGALLVAGGKKKKGQRS